MKIRDLIGKKILFISKNGDECDWDERIIVEIDNKHVGALYYEGSISGYIEPCIQNISKEFIEKFIKDWSAYWCEKDEKFEDNYNEFGRWCLDSEITIYDKAEILGLIKQWQEEYGKSKW